MEKSLRERIQGRLDALGLTAREAALRVDLNPIYIYDFLIGKKKSLKDIEAVAKALECSPDFLLHGVSDGEALRIRGVIQPGVWVYKQPEVSYSAGIAADDAFPVDGQAAFYVKTKKLAAVGIPSDSVIIATKDRKPRVGSLVVIRRRREGDGGIEHELTVEEIVDGEALREIESLPDDDRFGVVIRLMKTFPTA